MKNPRLQRLRGCVLRAVGALSLLSLPGASAADDTHGTAYTTAVFAREVQVYTTTWWKREGVVLQRHSGFLSSPSASGAVFSNHLLRFRPRVESLDVTLMYELTDVVSLYTRFPAKVEEHQAEGI